MPGSVSVPVLSRHTTSTRASSSTAGSSCTSTWCRPSRTTPTAKATLVSSTSPSGIMVITPATAPLTAVPRCSWLRSWLQVSSTATGTMIVTITRRIVLMLAISCECTRVNRRASSASPAAKACEPTAVAW